MTSKQTVVRVAAFACAFAAVVLAGPAAEAFDTQSSASFGATSNLADPDEQVANFGGAQGSSQQLASGPSYQADGYRRGQKRDLSGPLFRSLTTPIVRDSIDR